MENLELTDLKKQVRTLSKQIKKIQKYIEKQNSGIQTLSDFYLDSFEEIGEEFIENLNAYWNVEEINDFTERCQFLIDKFYRYAKRHQTGLENQKEFSLLEIIIKTLTEAKNTLENRSFFDASTLQLEVENELVKKLYLYFDLEFEAQEASK